MKGVNEYLTQFLLIDDGDFILIIAILYIRYIHAWNLSNIRQYAFCAIGHGDCAI